MSGRDRERERDRRAQAASARTNEYFVPKDGIDREVITADICRYLGNDALVRPGTYENPTTRQVQQGYFITAYRNLTTAMIADLKADSARWEDERRATASAGGRPGGVEYRASTTHQSRQYYGPTEAAPAAGYPAAPAAQPQVDYNSQYGQQTYAQPAPASYPQTQYAVQDSNYYVAGGDLQVDPRGASGRGVPSVTQAQPRGTVYASTPTYQQDSRTVQYQYAQPGVSTVSASQYPTPQGNDPYYGRSTAPVPGTYDSSQDSYDPRYQDSSVYSQPAAAAASSSTTTSTNPSRSSRGRDERDPDRDSRHHRSRR